VEGISCSPDARRKRLLHQAGHHAVGVNLATQAALPQHAVVPHLRRKMYVARSKSGAQAVTSLVNGRRSDVAAAGWRWAGGVDPCHIGSAGG
jgi:hypothetical protein